MSDPSDRTEGRRGLKRHAALVPLSRDHHFALMHALSLRRAAEAPLGHPPGTLATAEAFLAFWGDELVGHMADEEEALLPFLGDVAADLALRLRAEHEDLRLGVALLRQAIADGVDPRPRLREIGDLLHDHVRFEERVFFERVQEGLPEPALREIGRAIDAHREARGRRTGCSVAVVPPRR
jgi:hypothetical protein